MRLAEWRDTQTEQKQNKTKNWESLNCKFNNHSLIDFTDWHHAHTAVVHTRPLQLVDTLYKFLSITAAGVVLKIDRDTGKTKTGSLEVSSHASLACRLFCYSDSDLFKKFFFFFNAKVKSRMIKCINYGFRSDGHCQCCRPCCVLCCVVTQVFRSNRVQSLTLN